MQRRRIAFSCAAIVVGAGAAGLLGEFALRAFWPQRSAVTIGMFRSDEHAGYALVPNYRNVVRVPEYRTDIRTDSEGYRVGARDLPPDAPHRVLAIGDSFTFGVGVQAEEAWPAVLERLLDPEQAGEVRVRNGGVGGYGPLRSSQLLFSRQESWNPDVVVHGVYVGNDFEDPAPETYRASPRIRDGRMVVPGTGRLMAARYWLRIHSHLYAFVREHLYALYRRTPFAHRPYLDSMGRREWPEHVENVSWPAARSAIREIASWARERDVEYLVVLIPLKYQVTDEAWDVYQRRWRLAGEEFDRDRPQRRAAKFLEEAGIAHVDLLPALRDDPRRDRLYYSIDAHWTPDGHRRAAEAIDQALREHGWSVSARSGAAPPSLTASG